MADYTPPSLDDLLAYVARDLVDPENKVWSTEQLTDFINGGIGELNRVRALESVESIVWDEDTETLPLSPIVLEAVWQVELRSPDNQVQLLLPHAPSGVMVRDGWDYYAQTLWLGPTWSAKSAHYASTYAYSLIVWGYRPRDPLLVGDDIAEFIDISEEQMVRLYCKMEGWRSLNMDRGQFQQWQQQANNSDVSPTQLNGMLGTAEASFDRQQKRMFLPRRIPAV